jgi:hypothetical protein
LDRWDRWHCTGDAFAGKLVIAGEGFRIIGRLPGHKSLSTDVRHSDLATAGNAAAVGRLVTVPQTAINTTTGTATSVKLKSGPGD